MEIFRKKIDGMFSRKEYNSLVGVSIESSNFSPMWLPSTARMTRVAQRSAPINIPDWLKIYGKNSKEASYNNTSCLDNIEDNDDRALNDGDERDDDDDNDMKLPSHEWLAKKQARSQISSFSGFESVGRTLKGRDLSRVRNVVS